MGINTYLALVLCLMFMYEDIAEDVSILSDPGLNLYQRPLVLYLRTLSARLILVGLILIGVQMEYTIMWGEVLLDIFVCQVVNYICLDML